MADSARPPLPPFTHETALIKVRMAEDGWNSRDPQKVALGYSTDCPWRNRGEFPSGRKEIIEFLKRKWEKELDYRLIKELWAVDGNRIEPPVSEPSEAKQSPAAVATPEPEDDAPDQ